MTDDPQGYGMLSRRAAVGMILGAGAGMLILLAGLGRASLAILVFLLTEGVAAAGIVIAAGGYGHLVVRRLAPQRTPAALRVVTACAVGLWLLSVLVLLAGTAFAGLLRPWFAWPVVGIGLVLAAWQGRKRMEAWRLPEQFDGRVLTWAVVAVAVAVWLVGAGTAPGLLPGVEEVVDQLERHLQIPREYCDAQRIEGLRHNCYSYHPLGVEMLFLLAMAMRGGAYGGLYVAKLLHGVFVALAAAGVFAALRQEEDLRGRMAAAMLVTSPLVLWLSWQGLTDLAPVAYAALSLLWLREYLRQSDARAALLAGVMVGGACATGYQAWATVAVPIAVPFVLYRARRPHLLAHVGLWMVGALVPVLPWLVRNVAYTGNPVFPLATEVLGRGHWPQESQQRWVSAHSIPPGPPVPQPEGWRAGPQLSRPEMFYNNFVAYGSGLFFGLVVIAAAAVSICALFATRGVRAWEWLLAGVIVMQMAMWVLVSPQMSWRSILPVMVPVALIAAWGLSRLASVQANPFRKTSKAEDQIPWGLRPAVALTVLAVVVNLVMVYRIYKSDSPGRPVPPPAGLDARIVADGTAADYFLPAKDCRVLLVAEPRVFYFPSGSMYATSFDGNFLAHLSEQRLSPQERLEKLRAAGLTHILVNWFQLWPLAATTGYPACLTAGLYERAQTQRAPVLAVLADLDLAVEGEGPKLKAPTTAAASPATAPATQDAWRPWNFPAHWPAFTVYRLPWARPTTRPAAVAPAD